MKLPYSKVPRFVELPSKDGIYYLMYMEDIIKGLLEKYENQETYTDCEEYRREGAVGVLEELLEIINGK